MKKALAALVLSATVLLLVVAGCCSSSAEGSSVGAPEVDAQRSRGTEFVSQPGEVGPPRWSVLKPDSWAVDDDTPGFDDTLSFTRKRTATSPAARDVAGFASKNAPNPDVGSAELLQVGIDMVTSVAKGAEVTSTPTTIDGHDAMVIETRGDLGYLTLASKSTVIAVPRIDGPGLAILFLTTTVSDGATQQQIDDVEQLHNTIKIL
ncbi:hypothetical protein [Rhodococcus qingshengii]|uniref:hypothetical protein n=1 Tax=Rhodococcus qingshengii TaxID=334542 RepID=UPI00287F8213|nr:hypothetical protein [Rhodococcus qingshengii]